MLLVSIFGFLNICFSQEISRLSTEKLKCLQKSSIYTCEIIADPKQGKYGYTVLAKLLPDNIKVQLGYSQDSESLSYGNVVEVAGSFKPLDFTIYDRYNYMNGVVGKISVRKVLNSSRGPSIRGYLSKLRLALSSYIDNVEGKRKGKALLKALLLGDTRDAKEFSEVFRISGLSHLLSVSGTHLAIVCGGALLILSKLGLPKVATLMMSFSFGAIFAVITGLQPSTLRALSMFCIIGIVYFFDRRSDSLHALGVAACILLIASPHLAGSTGFQLSVFAVMGIFLFLKLFESWINKALFFMPRFVNSALALSFSAQSVSFPIVALTFRSVSLISPVANLAAGALTTIALSFGVTGGILSLFYKPLGTIVLRVSVLVCEIIVALASQCAAVPWSFLNLKEPLVPYASSLFVVCLMGLIFFLWPVPKKKRSIVSPKIRLFFQVFFFILTVFFLIGILFPGLSSSVLPVPGKTIATTDGVYVLDVGQGDSTLISSKGHAILIDAGPDSAVLKARLRELGVTRIDTLMFTHTHQDHLAGAKDLGRSYGVSEIVVASGAEYDSDVKAISRDLGAPVRTILAGDVLKAGEFELTCLSPKSTVYDSDANESCLIIFADDDEAPGPDFENILIPGDAEAVTVMRVLANTPSKVEVFRVGHHGSARSVNENLLVLMRPDKAVISVGRDNSYGHPKPNVLELLNRFEVPYLRTDLAGTIYIGAKVP